MANFYASYPFIGGGGGGGSGVVFGDPASGFVPGEIQYVDQSGNQYGDTQFTRLSTPDHGFNVESNLYATYALPTGGGNGSVAVIADTVGAPGNSIALVANGSDDITTILATWNGANPSNTASLQAGQSPTDVPDAGTYTLFGGGTASYGSGDVTFAFGDFQGAGTIVDDPTNQAFTLDLAGNLQGITGSPGLTKIFGVFDTANHKQGICLLTPDGITINSQTNSAQATLSLNSTQAGIGVNGTSNLAFRVDGTGAIGWKDNNANETFALPTTPPVSSSYVLGVSSTGGGVTILDWVLGGGGGGTVGQNQIAFGDASTGAITSSTNFKYNDSQVDFSITGSQATFDFAGNSGTVNTRISGKWSVNAMTGGHLLNIDPAAGQYGFGDLNGTFNETYWLLADTNQPTDNYAQLHGLRKNVLSGPTFSGSGLNDMTVAGTYNGNNTNSTFSATITSLNSQRLNVHVTAGPWPTVGNTILDQSSGATGTVVDIGDGASFFVVENIGGGIYSNGDNISGTGGFVATVTAASVLADMYSLDNSGASISTNNPCVVSPSQFIKGVAASFAASSGHTVGDNWLFNYSVTFSDMAIFDGMNRIFYWGDVDDTLNGTKIRIHDPNKNVYAEAEGGFIVQSPTAHIPLLAIYPTTHLSVLGDDQDLINGTKIDVDVGNQLISVQNDGIFKVQSATGNFRWIESSVNNYVKIGDLDNHLNGTVLEVSDINEKITATSALGFFATGNLYGANLLYIDAASDATNAGWWTDIDNATYDSVAKEWNRIDISKPAHAKNSRGLSGNIPYETTGGVAQWVAQPGANPISNTYGAVGGWQTDWISIEHNLVVGGYALEMDGNGTVTNGYGRFINSTLSGSQYIGTLSNLFGDFSSVDDVTKPSWFMGIVDDTCIIKRAAAGAGSSFSNLFLIDAFGDVTISGNTEVSGTLKGNFAAYASDADAGTGGLVTGQTYQTSGTGIGIFAFTGVVMVKQ